MQFNRKIQFRHTGVPCLFINGWQFHLESALPRCRHKSETPMLTKHCTFQNKLWHSGKTRSLSAMAETQLKAAPDLKWLKCHPLYFTNCHFDHQWQFLQFLRRSQIVLKAESKFPICLFWCASGISDNGLTKFLHIHIFNTIHLFFLDKNCFLEQRYLQVNN